MEKAVADLRSHPSCQARECMDEQALEEYADAYRAGETLPPIDVFEVEAVLVIVDGFHRHEAAKRAGVLTLAVRVVGKGSMADAEWHALGSNQKHGLRRTREDKRRAVRLALELDDSRGNREIARHLGVSDPFVGKVRDQERRPHLPPEWLDPNLVSPEAVDAAASFNDHVSFPSMKIVPRDIDRLRRLKGVAPWLMKYVGNGSNEVRDQERFLAVLLEDELHSAKGARQRLLAALIAAIRSECDPEVEAEKKAADAAGMNVETYRKAEKVKRAYEDDPHRYAGLPETMDADGVEAALSTMHRLSWKRDLEEIADDVERAADLLADAINELPEVTIKAQNAAAILACAKNATNDPVEPADSTTAAALWRRLHDAGLRAQSGGSEYAIRRQALAGKALTELEAELPHGCRELARTPGKLAVLCEQRIAELGG